MKFKVEQNLYRASTSEPVEEWVGKRLREPQPTRPAYGNGFCLEVPPTFYI